MLLKALKAAARSLVSRGRAPVEHPLETERRLSEIHGRAPVDRHLDMLYGDVVAGGETFAALYSRCLRDTGTAVTPFNVFQRFQTRLDLLRYFLATLALPGARAECGVYRGATALMLLRAWRARDPACTGADFHLIDSFSGTSASTEHDLIPVLGADGTTRREAFFPPGKTDTSPELVRGYFSEFPGVGLHAGWIPRVFAAVPERRWAFVHLDLTLYEPTLASLEYFYPRLETGGVLICDGSIFCPGAERAWNEFCERQGLAYVTLGHRETVLIK